MNFKQKLIFTAFGATLALAGYLLATLGSDFTAQSETDKATVVDEIVCRKSKVVDANGEIRASIDAVNDSAALLMSDVNGSVLIMSPKAYEAKKVDTNVNVS